MNAQEILEALKSGQIDKEQARQLVEQRKTELQGEQDSSTLGAQEDPGVLSKAWDAGAELVSGMGSFIGKTAENAADNSWAGPFAVPVAAGETIVNGLASMPLPDAINAVGRGAAQTAGAALGGSLGSVVPFAGTALGATAGGVLAGQVYDTLNKSLGENGLEEVGRDGFWNPDVAIRDTVQLGAPLAVTGGASKIMGKLASTIEPWATKEKPFTLDAKATIADPANKPFLKMGESDAGHPLTTTNQKLRGIENGAEIANEQFSDVVAQNMGILDSSVANNLGTYQLIKSAEPALKRSGIFEKRLSGPDLVAEAEATAQRAYQPLVDTAGGITSEMGGENFQFGVIKPALDTVMKEAEKFKILRGTAGIAESTSNTIDDIAKSFAHPMKSGMGLNANEMLDLAQKINFFERENLRMFDDPNLVADLRKKSPTLPAEVEASTRALSAAREAIYDVLNTKGQQLGLVDQGQNLFKEGAQTYGAMKTVTRAVELQKEMRERGLSAVSTRRTMQTQGPQATNPNRFQAQDVTNPTRGLIRRGVETVFPEDTPSVVLDNRVRARQQPYFAASQIGDVIDLQAGMTPGQGPRSVLKAPSQLPARVGRSANTAAEAADLVREKVGMIDAPGVATLRALMPVRDPVSEQPKIPRQIKMLSPQVLGQSLLGTVEPYNVMNVLTTFQNVWASGDKQQLGNFMAALTRKYPTLPIEKGPLTGLASEIVREDGNSYISDPWDVKKHREWLDSQDESVLPSDEKAIRVQKLNTTGQVFPLAARLSPARAVAMPQISNQSLTQGYGR